MPGRMPERMPEWTPQRMPDRMSDRMSEYTSDRMPDIMSEYMSDRMSIGGDHSKKVTIFSSFCYLYRTSDLIYHQFLHVFHETRHLGRISRYTWFSLTPWACLEYLESGYLNPMVLSSSHWISHIYFGYAPFSDTQKFHHMVDRWGTITLSIPHVKSRQKLP